MANFEEANRLLSAARKDLKALFGMGDALTFAEEIFGFHAQQAAEKALKAWLCARNMEYPKTHDLSLLLSRLKALGQPVEEWSDLIELNAYAVQFRYEAFDELGEALDREAVASRVETLVRLVEGLTAGP